MKKKFSIVLLFFFCFLNAQNSAYIYQDSILNVIPNYTKNLSILDNTSKAYQKEIKELKENLKIKINELLLPYNPLENENVERIKQRMTAIDTSQLSIYMDEEKIIVKRAKNYDLVANALYTNTVEPLLNKLNKTIEQYAKKNKIDVIYIIEHLRPALAYIDPKKNITKKIIELNK